MFVSDTEIEDACKFTLELEENIKDDVCNYNDIWHKEAYEADWFPM